MKLTLETIKSWEVTFSVQEILERIDEHKPERPIVPKRVRLKDNHTKEDVLKYADELEKYEIDLKQYEIVKSDYHESLRLIEVLKEVYIKYVTDFESIVPKEYQNKVWSKAYSDECGNGWMYIYSNLVELINLFELNN